MDPNPTPAVPTCAICATRIGEAVKVQPTHVDGKAYCPTCFHWHRAHQEPARLAQPARAVIRCRLCGWTTLSFFAGIRGRRPCGQCGRDSGVKEARPTRAEMTEITQRAAALRASAAKAIAAAPKAHA